MKKWYLLLVLMLAFMFTALPALANTTPNDGTTTYSATITDLGGSTWALAYNDDNDNIDDGGFTVLTYTADGTSYDFMNVNDFFSATQAANYSPSATFVTIDTGTFYDYTTMTTLMTSLGFIDTGTMWVRTSLTSTGFTIFQQANEVAWTATNTLENPGDVITARLDHVDTAENMTAAVRNDYNNPYDDATNVYSFNTTAAVQQGRTNSVQDAYPALLC